MRACVVDCGASQLAKLLVEPVERRFAAALLLDASCLLFPLPATDRSRQVLLQAPPCSDACFLRLHSSKQQQQQQLQLQFGQFGQQQQLGRTFFLVASSATGGSHTDIRAWSCCDSGRVRQVPVEATAVARQRHQQMVARLAIPHSAGGVKLAASVNVVAIYSPLATKLWILAAKASSSLLLVKTVVIDCGAHLYSMHVSPQYLLLGETGSVRLLALRPLLKRRRPAAKHRDLNGHVDKDVAVGNRKKRNGYVEAEDGRHVSDGKSSDPNPLLCSLSIRAPVSSSQVVAIRPVSAKSFLALDSAGRLHRLTLRRPAGGSMPVEVKPVDISFAVSAFAVLPYDPKAAAGPRRLWASDGRYSIHVFSLPDEEVDGGRAVEPSVVQAVFLGASAASLVASSPDTVLAVTEGTVVAYAYGGS